MFYLLLPRENPFFKYADKKKELKHATQLIIHFTETQTIPLVKA